MWNLPAQGRVDAAVSDRTKDAVGAFIKTASSTLISIKPPSDEASESDIKAYLDAALKSGTGFVREGIASVAGYNALSPRDRASLIALLQIRAQQGLSVHETFPDLAGGLSPKLDDTIRLALMAQKALNVFLEEEKKSLDGIQSKQKDLFAATKSLQDRVDQEASDVRKAVTDKEDELRRLLGNNKEQLASSLAPYLNDYAVRSAGNLLHQERVEAYVQDFLTRSMTQSQDALRSAVRLPEQAALVADLRAQLQAGLITPVSLDTVLSRLQLPQVALPNLADLKKNLDLGRQLSDSVTTYATKELQGLAAGFMKKLGLPSSPQALGGDLVSLGSMTALTKISAGIMAVQGIANLLGGGLGGISKSDLAEINGKLDEIIRTQQLILKNLETIEKKIDALRQEVAQGFREVMDKLEVMDYSLITIGDTVFDLANVEFLRACPMLQTEDWPKDPGLVFLRKQEQTGKVQDCINYFRANLADTSKLSFLRKNDPNLRTWITKRVYPVFRQFADDTKNIPESVLTGTLVNPAGTVAELEGRLAVDLADIKVNSGKPTSSAPLMSIWPNTLKEYAILDASAVKRMSLNLNRLVDFRLRFVPAAAGDGRLITPDDFNKLQKPQTRDGLQRTFAEGRAESLRLLEQGVKVVNAAIAQQTVLAGDQLVGTAQKWLVEKRGKEFVPSYMLASPILARNAVHYFVWKRMKANAIARSMGLETLGSLYAFAYSSADASYFQVLTDQPDEKNRLEFRRAWPMTGSDRKPRSIDPARNASDPVDCASSAVLGKWHLVLDPRTCVALPTPEEFSRGELLHSSDASLLEEIRTDLLRRIAQLRMEDDKQISGSHKNDAVLALAMDRVGVTASSGAK